MSFQKNFNNDLKTLLFLVLFGNTVFVGFPIITAVYGEVGLFLAVIYNLVHLIIMWTYGLKVMSDSKLKLFSLDFIKEPCIIAMIASVVMVFCNISLPTFLTDTFKMVGSMTYPLSFIIIGLSVDLKLLNWQSLKTNLILIGLKMITVPLLLVIVVKLLGLEMIVAGVVAVMSGTPSAVLAVVFSEKYKGNVQHAAEGVVITSIAGMVTIPVNLVLVLTLY